MSAAESNVAILFVRLLPGVVGESRRVCHIVPVTSGAEVPAVLTAYCGEQIKPGAAELLPAPAGMGCYGCLLNAPMPAPDNALPAGIGGG